MSEFTIFAVFVMLLSLIPIRVAHQYAQERLLLEARLREEELASEEAQDMRRHQRQRETDRSYMRDLREANREYFRLERELDEGDEPWKR